MFFKVNKSLQIVFIYIERAERLLKGDFVMSIKNLKILHGTRELLSGVFLVLALATYIGLPDNTINDVTKQNVDCTGLIAAYGVQLA